ncbi:MAG TPA: hypothetical protein VHK23_05770 [Miltoncostaeaceae bacterium]|jgi:hypothetical protein|nr:hypothetical protein [Miltoncostaeaceae bacterium]
MPAAAQWDYGEAFGTRQVLNFADPEGVYFQLLQQPPSNAQLHAFTGGDNPFD